MRGNKAEIDFCIGAVCQVVIEEVEMEMMARSRPGLL